MRGLVEHFVDVTNLNDRAKSHHADASANLANNRKIMTDEHHREIVVLPQIV
jgi:hypothetical protein